MSNKPALVIENLQKTYKNGAKALKGIDLTIKQGDFFALLGPNGAGKSTIIGIICSLVNKSSGRVCIFDTDIDTDWAKAKSFIGVVPQEFNFNVFEPVFNIVANQAGYYGLPRKLAKERAKICLKQVSLWDKRKTAGRSLSGGMKRRLLIARALVHEPRLLILDEPTAGVDIEIRRSMWALMRQLNKAGTTIILTTHYLEEAEHLCKNIAIIDDGRIIENTTMKKLLAKLNTESFILDIREPLTTSPIIKHYDFTLLDPTTLEVEIPKEKSLNELFTSLSQQHIDIVSMRNKSSRLEELFLRLTQRDTATPNSSNPDQQTDIEINL